jgi:hypothetical protein
LSNTEIHMENNNIETLNENVFRIVLDALITSPVGKLHVDGESSLFVCMIISISDTNI